MHSLSLLPVPLAAVFFVACPQSKQVPTPEERAVAFLAREVPRWPRKNQCYSCHNNGDAARALYTAARLRYRVPADALADTTRWLLQPQQWDHNGGDPGFSDKGLARIQFAAALMDAVEAGFVRDQRILSQAAELVAGQQQKDGSWQIDAAGAVGSPTTYGPFLATCQACRIFRKSDPEVYRAALSKAGQWLRRNEAKNVLDAAAKVLALHETSDREAAAQVAQCLALIRKGEVSTGGWGPYVNSPAEPFDTAVVLLALAPSSAQPAINRMIQRGRRYLVSMQQPDGSWIETTRPAGGQSYAQRISTTGWAALALLATRTGLPDP